MENHYLKKDGRHWKNSESRLRWVCIKSTNTDYKQQQQCWFGVKWIEWTVSSPYYYHQRLSCDNSSSSEKGLLWPLPLPSLKGSVTTDQAGVKKKKKKRWEKEKKHTSHPSSLWVGSAAGPGKERTKIWASFMSEVSLLVGNRTLPLWIETVFEIEGPCTIRQWAAELCSLPDT